MKQHVNETFILINPIIMWLFKGVYSVKVIVIKIRLCRTQGAREPFSDVMCNFLKRVYHTDINEGNSNALLLALHHLCKTMKEILAIFYLKNLFLRWCGYHQYCEFCHGMRRKCGLLRHVHSGRKSLCSYVIKDNMTT